MKIRTSILLLITTILLTSLNWRVGYAQTQPDVQIDLVNLYLLPEFNQPNVLVIFEIRLNDAVALPQQLIFEIPADAVVIRVINYTSDDRPVELRFQESRFGNWKDLIITPNTHRIRITYQDPNLVRQGNLRQFEFQWLSLYPVSVMTVRVRQPLGASTILSQPPLEIEEIQNDEVRYFSTDLGAIDAGDLFTFTFEYSKAPGDPNLLSLPVEPALPLDEITPSSTPSSMMVILWLIILGVAVTVIVGLYFWWFRININEQKKLLIQGVGIMNLEKQSFYCHECGLRTKVGDRFCSNCGTELRLIDPFEITA